jgi:Mrp family chromosome partitioning ATPase
LSSFEDPKSRPAAEMRKLHDFLRAGRKKWTGQSILLVAPHDGGEAGAVAFNLAVIAAANHSVLLIDGDSHRQALAAVFPHQSQAGLIDIASGQKLLSEIVTRVPHTNIHMLPLFARRIGSYRDVKNEDIKTAFDQTKKFDLVIILGSLHDGNPVAAFFAGLVDQVVLIVKEGATRKRDIDGALSILGSNARKIRGTVLTNVQA